MVHYDSSWRNRSHEHSENGHGEYRRFDGQATVVIDDSWVIDSFVG